MTNTTTMKPGTLEHIDPNAIVFEANVRTDVKLTPKFLANIKREGVLTPILARRDEQGNVLMRTGQRRVLAAREGQLDTIPVYIVEADASTAERIFQQLMENEQRAAMDDHERVVAYQQLAFEGFTANAIAKRLGDKPADVKAGIAVAENGMAASAIVSHSLTLEQAATLIEFEDDDETVSNLIATAVNSPEQFAHAAQRARDEIRLSAMKAEAVTDLIARGFTILDREPGYYETNVAIKINDLVTKEGIPVTVDDIVDVGGRAAFVRVYYTSEEATVIYYLNDFKAAGFKKHDTGSTSGPMTDEQKAERKTLIANNKAWVSAEVVRREWLATFLSRKTLPKDAAKMIANGLTTHRAAVGNAATGGNALAHKLLLGIENRGYWDGDKLSAMVANFPLKAQHVALAVVLGGIEDSTDKGTWRYPDAIKAGYFTQLAAWGYGLSEVEQIVTDSQAVQVTDEDPADTHTEDGDEVTEE